MSKSTRTPRIARRPAPQRALRRHHIAAATLAMLGTGGNAAPVTWVGADDGFWDATSNWDAGQPGAGADVQLLAFQTTLRSGNYGIRSLTGSGRLTLSGGSLSFSEASSLGSMLLSGGTLGGSGSLLVSGTSEWQRGTINGSGAATFSGGLAITGTDVHDLVGRTLVLGGTSSWANSAAGNQGQIRMGSGAVLHNSGSLLDQTSASTTINGNLGGAASSFSNSGTYTKTGSGVTTVQVAFNNSGQVNGTGTLVLSNGGTHSGAFAMDEGGTVRLDGGTHTFSGHNAAGGAGRLLLSSGTATAGGGSMSTTGRWDLEGGTISGAGNMALGGVANWSGTTFGGGSSTSFGGALAIVGTGVHDVSAASVTFAGTTTWTNSAAGNQGQIRTGSGATLSNTGTFIDATSANTSINASLGGSASSFANSGTYRKTGASTTNITTQFNNGASGTIQVDAGTLQLGGGGTSSGSIDVAPTATLEFAGGTHHLSGLSSGTGTGRVLVSGGTVNASGSNSITGRLAISGGTLNTSGSFAAGGFDMSGGTLGGTGAADIALSASSTGTWTQGSIARSGSTTFTGPLAVGGTGVHDVVGGTLVLAGTTTWTNSAAGNQGQFRMGSGAVLDNSGSFLDQITAGTTINGTLGGAASSFTNSGTYTKTGAGITTVQVVFNNTGLVNGTGTLVLSGGGTHSGTFAMGDGGTVQLNGGTHSFVGDTLGAGAGRVLLSSGATAATSAGNAMSTTARWDLEGGTVSGAGSMAFNGISNWTGTSFSGGSHSSFGDVLSITGSGVHDVSSASVTFAGTTTWTNSAAGNQGQIRTGSSAALSNTGTFIDATSANTTVNPNLGGAASSFANSGTYRKTGGSTTTVSTLFNNTGTVQVDAGTLQLAGGGSSSGTLDVAAGATLDFSGGTHTVSGLSGGTGTGRVLVSAGTVNASGSNAITGALAISGGALNTSGSFSAGAFDMSGGTLGGSGAAAIALSASSAGSWTNGAIARNGTTTFTGPLAVGGTGVHDVSGGTLVLAGTTTWTNSAAGNQGQFRTGSGAVIHNSGSFLDQITAGTSINGSLGGAASSFSNTGTYTKTGTGTTTLEVVFNNAGLVDGTGTLVLSNGGTHSGTFAMDDGGTVRLNGGTHSFSGTSAAGGLGRVHLVDGATATTASAMSTTGRWDLNGGTMNGAGHFMLGGVANWTAGTQAGTGNTTFGGALALSGNGYRDISQRSVNFAGTTTWTNAAGGNVGRFRTGSGAVLTNSGSFLDQTSVDTNIENQLGGSMSRFDNTGTYAKSGGTNTIFYIPFNNAAGATTQVNAGRLLLVNGGTSSGTFDVASGATLEFGGGTHNLSGLSAGPGTGRMLVSTGLVNTTGANSYGGMLALTAGTLTVGGTLLPGVFEQTGGIVNGAGTLALNGSALWTQGSQTEAGSTVFSGALALSGNSYRDVSQRSVNFAGTTTWTNAPGNNVGRFRTGNGAVLTNSGNWLDQTVADTNFANELGGAMSRFDNTGSYAKSGPATTTLDITTSNTGALRVSGGVLNLSRSLTNFAGSTLTGGTYEVFGPGILQFASANIVTNAAAILLDGASSQLRNASNNANALANFATNTAAGRFTVQSGRNFTTLGAFNNAGVVQVGNASTFTSTGIFSNALGGTLQMAGGSFAGPTVPNAGLVGGFGNVAPALANSGTVRASGGTLTLSGGVQGSDGGVFIDTGATLVLGAPGSAATLGHSGSLLALGANDITVHQDYDNASFGAGNSFDRRAAVSGSGLILAAGLTQQTLSGALLQGGSSGSATITLPNIRVGLGGISTDFSIHNVGTGGPSLRGALQNTGIDNVALSGSGVTAQNWGAVTQGGASAPFTVTFDPAFGQALSGQTLQVVNNFFNVAGQTLTITGSAYNLASASPATPNPVQFANQREGGSLSQALTLSNRAPANGFSESLNASISGSGPVLASGSFSLLAAGASNSTALVVGLDTSSAGAKAGTATITLESDGTGNSGFGALDIGTQSVDVSGSVYRLATASATTPNPVALANQRVGGTLTQSLSLTNTAAADGFSEGLNASIAASGSATAGGSFSVLAAGQSSSALFVGVDTRSAGTKSGTATLTLASDGNGTSGFSALDIGTQTVNVSGNVYRLASASAATPNPVLLVNQRLGGGGVQTLTISNTALADGFSEGLNASIVGSGDITASGSFALLAAGATDSTSLRVGVDTTKAGSLSGTAIITLASDGTTTSGLGALGIGKQTIQVVGNTYRLASASAAAPNPVLFANQRVGGTATQALSISNTAAADGFSESLNVSISTSGPVNAGGVVNLLAAGATSNDLFVGLDTRSAGAKAGTATLTLASDGTGSSGFGALGIGTQTVNVSGDVYHLASASAASPSPVVLANQRVGGTLSQPLSLSNTAAADGYSEGLNASIAATGDATAGGSFSVLAAGASSNALSVGIDTGTAGAKAGVATLTLASDGTGSSGFGALGIGTQTVSVSGSVYRLAQPVVDTAPIVLVARVGDAPPQRSVAVSNSGPDLFTERLNANGTAAPAGWVAAGSVNGLANGNSSPALTLALATGSAGSFAGTAQVALVSSGAGTTEAADFALGHADVSVTGRVYAPAVAQVLSPVVNFGIVRVGDVVAPRNVALGNAASGALADTLHATLSGGAAPFAASGSAAVVAGALDDTRLNVQLNTSASGVFNTTATLGLSSRNGELADLALGDAPVLLQAQVNALASAGLALVDGAVTLGGGAAAFTLDFGTLAAGGGALGATLSLGNLTLGTADALAGDWDLSGVGAGSSFTLSGFGSFAGLAAGSSLGGLSVTFDSGSTGHFEQVVVLRSLSTNGSGADLALTDLSLTLQGTVVAVPEPGTWLLMVGGLLLLARRVRVARPPLLAQRLAA